MLFTQLIQANLRTKALGKKIEYYNRIGSTNSEAWELLTLGADHGTIVLTDHQFQGKGRAGNSWFMGAGKGLAMSVILKNEYSLKFLGLISLAVGIAATKSIARHGLDSKLKWPNDIFIYDKKVGGILCETKIKKNAVENMVVGIGINVNEANNEFPDNIKDLSTSMAICSNHPHQRERVAAELLNFLESLLQMIHHDPKKIVHEWLDRCGHLNDPITFNDKGKVIEGIFSGLDDLGNARIKTDLGNRVYRSIY